MKAFSQMNNNELCELKKELERYVPAQYVPDIIKVEDIQEYILLGLMILCARSL